ncbi:hypothetical protein Acor_53780 [Acrocarpospora corrugata]|uniref:Uncharacterized protein n=1 Tax=Acrocarpospora corrugata TaxID=35763 RepID=A0A5M3W5K2_9ACTN|nr:hypothetical protein [Acrocarpospora corrugata]GES03312.1 hypothetical protein Acor_53780 [Acrocarpospora corrugata]
MSRTQRKAMWWRIQQIINSGGSRPVASGLELEMDSDPRGGPLPEEPASKKEMEALRKEAYENGVRDGSSGMYDEWSLSTGGKPPYLAMIDAKCNEAQAHERVRHLRDAQRLDERIAAAKQDLKQHQELAAQKEQQRTELMAEEKELQDALADRESDHPASGWGEATRSLTRRRSAAVARVAVMALLIAVELPIQYASFIFFGESPVLTWAFVLGTAGAMLIAPHQAGGWTRRLTVEGWASALTVTTLVVMAAWAVGVGLLALLRASVLFAPGFDDATLQPIASTVSALDLSQPTVTLLFGGLLTLSGLVAFTYGYLGENPYAAKLADIQRRRSEVEKALAKATGLRDRDEHLATMEKTLNDRHEERWQAQIAARGHVYEVCYATYLQAVAATMRNPAFTESSSQWLGHTTIRPGRPPAARIP